MRAAMAKAIMRGLKLDNARALPRLTDSQLFEGFRKSIDFGHCLFDRDLFAGLTPGEVFSLTISWMLESPHLGTGGCLQEVMESVGIKDTKHPSALAACAFMEVFSPLRECALPVEL